MRSHQPKTLTAALDIIEKFESRNDVAWYRGSGKTSYKLTPTLYRHTAATSAENIEKLERDIFVRFKQRSLPFIQRNFTGDWDQLFFMQHYTIPTRLLDWSENPFVAL